MAYRIEGKDIVLSGFEEGISDSVYSGIADMRNVELITVPGEASVPYAQIAATVPPVRNAVAFTAQDAGDTITVASTTGFYDAVAIVLNTNTAGGLATGTVYYVGTITATTFQLFDNPALIGGAVPISSDGAGTFTTYQYGNQRGVNASAPNAYYVDRTGEMSVGEGVFLVDGSNYVWFLLSAASGNTPANSMVFMGNIGGVGASSSSAVGINIWKGYLFLLGTATHGVDIADIGDLWTDGPLTAWDYTWDNWSTQALNSRIFTLVSQEDGNLYFTSTTGIGSLIENPGDNFDPTDSNTYTQNDSAVLLPSTDESTCIAELGQNLLIGARGTFVYVWNKIDPGFSNLLNIPDVLTSNIVATSQSAYVFAGNRGRIYVTNGSGIDLYKKVPDYLTGTINPYITWRDANFSNNQLIFTFYARNNADTILTTVAGAWLIDLQTDALRMLNKTTNSTYAGITMMAVPRPPASVNDNPTGTGLAVGWYDSTTYVVDVGTTAPYTTYETFIEHEMIPVGTFLDPFTPSQIEWKTAAPLVAGEGVKIYYRKNITDSFTLIGESTTAGFVSDLFQTNFEKAQWVQLRSERKSTATTPSFNRLTEVRIRDWPSGKNAKG